jgi:hypothetical protein
MLAGARSLVWGRLGALDRCVAMRMALRPATRFSRSSAVALRTSLTVARSRAANASPGRATVLALCLPSAITTGSIPGFSASRARGRNGTPTGPPPYSVSRSYRETPFDEPLRGAEAIRTYWSDLPQARSDIRFAYELLAVVEQWGIAHWHGSYTPVDRATRLELDGILLVSLDDDGRCEDFREWSNRRLVTVPPATG